jgi:hypothetical protein
MLILIVLSVILDFSTLAWGKSYSDVNQVILDRNKSFGEQIITEGTVYIIRYEFDLNGDTVAIPKNSTLIFENGLLRNGVLKGTFTKIEAGAKAIFANMVIDGEWDIPKIHSEWFKDIYDQQDVILQLFNLSNDSIDNVVLISKGTYSVTIREQKAHEPVISIRSRTDVELNGTIYLEDSIWATYGLLDLNNVHDVKIKGKGTGTVRGNLLKYDGRAQSGHLISIVDSKNVLIEGLNLLEAAGDGICIWGVGNNLNSNIIVRDCVIKDAKRQGISIGEGSDITVNNCNINNITSALRGPCAGIDIETDYSLHQIINNVNINNIEVDNVWSGLCVVGESAISNININGYTANNCQRYGLLLTYNVSDFTIENSSFHCTGNFKGTKAVNPGRCASFFAYSGKDVLYNDTTLQNNIVIRDCDFIYDLTEAKLSGNVGYNCHYGISLEKRRFMQKLNDDNKYVANFSILNSDKTNIDNCFIDVNVVSVSKSTETTFSNNLINANDFVNKSGDRIISNANKINLKTK